MKKVLFTLIFLGAVIVFPSCTKHYGTPQSINGTDEDYQVTFLFECNGVEIYRFRDGGRYRYFAVGNGSVMNSQRRVYKTGKSTHVEEWDDSVIKAR